MTLVEIPRGIVTGWMLKGAVRLGAVSVAQAPWITVPWSAPDSGEAARGVALL